MANLVNQPTQNPSNKLTAAIIAAAVVAAGQSVADIFWPGVFDQKVWTAMFPIVVWAAGYVVPDAATTVVVQKVVKSEIEVEPAK